MSLFGRCAFVLVLALAGCAVQQAGGTGQNIQNTESLLAAAGFRVHPADTPKRITALQALPPQQLVLITRKGRQAWVYADPVFCNCLYVGGTQAYQAFEGLNARQRIAETQLQAAQLGSFDDAWGPWPSGPFGDYDPWSY